MHIFNRSKSTFFDVDDTLVYFRPIPEQYDGPTVEITCGGITAKYGYIQENIDLLIEHKKRNHLIVVWTQSSVEFATAVVRALNLESYVDLIINKPSWIVDDLPSSKWMPEPRYGLKLNFIEEKKSDD